MDEKSFLRDYQDLSDVSDKNSDIMSSMLLDEKLREKGLIININHSEERNLVVMKNLVF